MKKILSIIFVLLFVASFAVVGCKKEESAADKAVADVPTEDSALIDESAKEIATDDSFVAYDNETVLDKRTGLMWAAKDNGKDLNWKNAKKYCENYRGGDYTDWRMPTENELLMMFDGAKPYKADCGFDVHLTKLIKLSCFFVWTSTTEGEDQASSFYFGEGEGTMFMFDKTLSENYRALPVRSAK